IASSTAWLRLVRLRIVQLRSGERKNRSNRFLFAIPAQRPTLLEVRVVAPYLECVEVSPRHLVSPILRPRTRHRVAYVGQTAILDRVADCLLRHMEING